MFQSKSIGHWHFIDFWYNIHELRKKNHGQTIRLALLGTHYRQPLDWTNELINSSKNILDSDEELLVEELSDNEEIYSKDDDLEEYYDTPIK